jgi:hypothetical protein
MNESAILSIHARRGEPWTAEEELLLASSLAEGQSLSEVAKQLGRSQSAVHCKALNLNVIEKRPRARGSPGTQRRRPVDFFLS